MRSKPIECKPFFVIAVYRRLVGAMDAGIVRRRMVESAFGGHPTNYSSFINGRKRPGTLRLKRICAVLGIGLTEFLEDVKKAEAGRMLEITPLRVLADPAECNRAMPEEDGNPGGRKIEHPCQEQAGIERLTHWQEFILFATNSLRNSVKGQMAVEMAVHRNRLAELEKKIDAIADAVRRMAERDGDWDD